eukprot:gene12862-27127_t
MESYISNLEIQHDARRFKIVNVVFVSKFRCDEQIKKFNKSKKLKVSKLQIAFCSRIRSEMLQIKTKLWAAFCFLQCLELSSMITFDLTKKTFYYTGSSQTYTVPTGINSLTVSVCGGKGGSNFYNSGGNGGCIRSLIIVTPNQLLYVLVGGKGDLPTAGYNGGGVGHYTTEVPGSGIFGGGSQTTGGSGGTYSTYYGSVGTLGIGGEAATSSGGGGGGGGYYGGG